MSYAMYPAVFEEFAVHFNTFGDVSKLSSDMVGATSNRFFSIVIG